MRLIARIATGLSVVLLVACCGVWLLLSAPRAGLEALTIPTGSMRPGMPPGSLVLVRQVPAASLHVGDIITYVDPFNPHKTITHRIIKTYLIGGRIPGFITKGDANTAPDVPIPAGSVQGEVIWHVPYAGKALSWVRSWTGIAVLVYLPAVLVVIEEVKRLRDYYRLSLPYRAAGYRRGTGGQASLAKLAAAPLAGVVMTGVLAYQPLAGALFTSNGTALIRNHISAAAPAASCRNDTHISVNGSSSQTAASGAATGLGAENGSASNYSSTTLNVSVNDTSC